MAAGIVGVSPRIHRDVEPSVAGGCAQPRGRLLLVAYAFPPVGGAGVQRPARWVKYLKRLGWELTVLTPSNPSVPARDDSLCLDLPTDLTRWEAATWEPSYSWKQRVATSSATAAPQTTLWRRTLKQLSQGLFQPDPQILWYPSAMHRAVRGWKQRPHDLVLVTAPPFSSLLIGVALKRRWGIPVICDFRDEWDISQQYLEHAGKGWWSRWCQHHLQRYVLRHADALVATTQASTQHLQQKLSELNRQIPVRCVYNGYDAEDFQTPVDDSLVPPCPSPRLRLVYTGTLWNLTQVQPLVQAFERMRDQPDALARWELVFVGRKTPEQQAYLHQLRAWGVSLHDLPYCPHREVLAWQRSADVRCVLLSALPAAERVVPAKLFEYLACGRAVFGIMPEGEAKQILERCLPGSTFLPCEVSRLAHWLATVSKDELAQQTPTTQAWHYSREQQTELLDELLCQLLASRRLEHVPCGH